MAKLEMTIGEIQLAQGLLHRIAQLEDTPRKTRYSIYQRLREFEGPLEDAERDLEAVREQFMKRNEDGEVVYTESKDGSLTVEITNPVEFRKKQEEIMDTQVSLNIEPLRASDLGDSIDEVARQFMAILVELRDFFIWDSED